MTRIVIDTCAGENMRLPVYNEPLAGDWYFDGNGDLQIRVVATDVVDEDEAFLIALHELIEAKLCLNAGVTQTAVDVFDSNWTGEGEPGDGVDAPYAKEHRKAMLIEHTMAMLMGKYDYGRME